MNRRHFLFLALIFAGGILFAQQKRGIVELPGMQVLPDDIIVSSRLGADGKQNGIDLYIRKKPQINSVMLVETTKDPEEKEANYAYRAGEWNEVNGNEKRYLNGRELNSDYSKYSLISSTVVRQEKLGECFHIYIPETIYFGYPWSRNGSVKIGRGTFINIRTFEKPYGDYTGRFMDNAFMFDLGKKEPPKEPPLVIEPNVRPRYDFGIEEIPEPIVEEPVKEEPVITLTDDYNSIAAEKFAAIAKDGNGLLFYSNPEKLTADLIASVENITPHKKADVVFAIDTTGSMKDDMEKLRKEWVPQLLDQIKEFEDIRLGLLFYRDYNDTYNYKGLPVKFFDFTRNASQFTKNLNTVLIHGNEGGDIPEAVYEALYAGLNFYEWRSDAKRKIILIGDAEPHPKPRGPKKISSEMVMELSRQKGIVLDCIIVPDEKASAK